MAIVQPPKLASESGVTAQYNMGYVWAISFVAAMGGLLFGYDFVVIGGAKLFFEKFFKITSESLSGWVNSCALLGCLLGSLLSGGLSDRFGRKVLLIASAFLFASSSVLTGWAMTLNAFIFWRIVGGVAIGMASNLSPMYIAEVAPAHMRGRLVSINQLTIVIGILAAQIVNWLIGLHHALPDKATDEMIRLSWGGQYGWRWMFTAVAVPSAVFFVSALFVPESPRWLVKSGRAALARLTLARIGGAAYADAEVADVQRTLSSEGTGRVRFDALFEPRVMAILIIGVTLAVLQQWAGINVIFNYAEEIYKSAGYGTSGILFNIVITGTINLLFTFIAIGTVDKVGRRALMLTGCAGIAVSHLLIGVSYLAKLQGIFVLVFTLCAIGCYAMTLAPVTWVLISEIFPNRIRGAAVSVAVSALWIACFILTFTFKPLTGVIGTGNTFWIYAAICAAGFFFILLKVPETKGKTLEQIEKDLTD